MVYKIGGKYNWYGQSEQLIYLGRKGMWHQFAKIESPNMVWCEVAHGSQNLIEETKEK